MCSHKNVCLIKNIGFTKNMWPDKKYMLCLGIYVYKKSVQLQKLYA